MELLITALTYLRISLRVKNEPPGPLEPKPGDILPYGFVPVKTPGGAPYTAQAGWAYWDAQNNCWVGANHTPVERNVAYRLHVLLQPEEGYEFADRVYLTAYGVKQYVSPHDHDFLDYVHDFAFYDQTIERVDVEMKAAPQAGQKPADMESAFSVSANAACLISDLKWYDTDHNPVLVFEKGKNYLLDIEFTAKPGYHFDPYAYGVVNNIPHFLFTEPTFAVLSLPVSLKTIIPQVRADELSSFEIGKHASIHAAVPANAPYQANVHWMVYDQDSGYEPFNGVFESGKLYRRDVVFNSVLADCAFDSNTLVYLNGSRFEHSYIRPGDNMDTLIISSYFHTGLSEIDEVFIKLDEPAYGTHSSLPLRIRLVNGSSAEVSVDNVQHFIGPLEFPRPFEGILKADRSHGIQLFLCALKDYVFAKDVTVVINGKRMPSNHLFNQDPSLLRIHYFLGMEGETCELALPPKTGDDSALPVWVGLMVSSLSGALVIIRRRRRTN